MNEERREEGDFGRLKIGDEEITFYWDPDGRLGMARACLNGQSFGFTPEDVDQLRSHSRSVIGTSGKILWMDHLADRIEALLPSREL